MKRRRPGPALRGNVQGLLPLPSGAGPCQTGVLLPSSFLTSTLGGVLCMSAVISVAEARRTEAIGQEVVVEGWIRTRRDSKAGFSFLELNDGSSFGSMQVVADGSLANYESEIRRLSPGCSVRVAGVVSASPGKGQATEIRAQRGDRLRHGRRGDLPVAEEGPFVRVPADDCPSPAAHQHVRGGSPGAKLRLATQSTSSSRSGLPLRPHADHHGQRLRGRRRHVQGHHAGPGEGAREAGGSRAGKGHGRRFLARLLRPAGLSDRQRTARGRDVRAPHCEKATRSARPSAPRTATRPAIWPSSG